MLNWVKWPAPLQIYVGHITGLMISLFCCCMGKVITSALTKYRHILVEDCHTIGSSYYILGAARYTFGKGLIYFMSAYYISGSAYYTWSNLLYFWRRLFQLLVEFQRHTFIVFNLGKEQKIDWDFHSRLTVLKELIVDVRLTFKEQNMTMDEGWNWVVNGIMDGQQWVEKWLVEVIE